MLVLITYDVSTLTKKGRKRLRTVAKACLDHSQRVQNSVFECLVNNDQWQGLKLRLLDVLDVSEDSLRFYFLGDRWQGRVEHHGTKGTPDLSGTLIA